MNMNMNTLRCIFLNPIGWFTITIILLSTVQWSCMEFLMRYCHSNGWWGLLVNPITLGNPVCVYANNIQQSITNHYVRVWTGAAGYCGVWLVSKLTTQTVHRHL
jgi:hypothetical protein